MGLQGMLARAALRQGVGGLAGVVVVLALGLGAALTSLEAADRTVSAYPDFLDRAAVGDVVVNPVIANERTDAVIRATPGVRRVRSDSLLTGAPLGPDGTPDLSSDFLQFRVSQDGRYLDQDRPAVREGRMIRPGASEAFLSTAAAEALGVGVGEDVEVGFFGVNEEDPTSIEPGPMVRRTTVRVVGIGTFADDVLADELFPREYALITPEAAGDADCVQTVPDPADERGPDELLVAVLPEGCTMTYRYWSLDLEDGRAGAAAVVAELGRRFQAESRNLPAGLTENDVSYNLIPAFTADDLRSVNQAVSPVVTALRAFAALAAVATSATVLVLVVRHLRRRSPELVVWRGLGLRRPDRVIAVGLLPVAAVTLGVVLAAVIAFVASPVGPVASTRTVDPHPGHGVGTLVLGAAGVALVVTVIATVAAAWSVAVSVVADRPSRRPSPGWINAVASPFTALGLRSASRGREAATAALGAAAAVAAVTATLLFAVAIGRVVDEPDRYGWVFDVAFLANYGYGPLDAEAVARDLGAREDVEAWGLATATGNLTIDGETVPSIAGRSGFQRIVERTPVVDGTLPVAADEIAVGAATAADLGLEVDDEVALGSFFGEERARVTGLVVLPDLGPFQSDRTSLGTGVLLPAAALEAVYGDAEAITGMTPAALADDQASVVMIDLVDGTDPVAFADDIEEATAAWDTTGFQLTFPEPSRPAAIVELASVRAVPGVLASLFAAAMGGAVVAGLAAGTRGRRRELAILRALGATRGQRRSTVRVHALTTVAIGLGVGLPVGMVLGRLGFARFAADLGVVDDLGTPPGLIAVVVAGAVLVALVTAEVLARRAAPASVVPAATAAGGLSPRPGPR